MKISIITVFPEMYTHFLQTSLVGRGIRNGTIAVNLIKFSEMCEVTERIDEPTCGHGAGMVIKPEVVLRAIEHAEQRDGKGFKIFFSPQGRVLTQPMVQQLYSHILERAAKKNTQQFPEEKSFQDAQGCHLILVCPRYEGMDERVEHLYAVAVVSVGDYILMGGDLPAQVFLESLLRLVPGIVGRQESVKKESFSGPFLDHPVYGLPLEWQGMKVPDVVLSGNHAALEEWRADQAAGKTILKRFDWFRSARPTQQEIQRARKHIPPHYFALMHTQVNLKEGRIGETSVTSLDIHDIARSCMTYGIKNYFVVSPLEDQQTIVATFMDFWLSAEGSKYNESRACAVRPVIPVKTFDDVLDAIKKKEGKDPLVISTSARHHGHAQIIDYHSQGQVWSHDRPVLFLFGTGSGLCDELLARSDYLLIPASGMTDYRHLSVRSAAAVVLDRWLGLQTKLRS